MSAKLSELLAFSIASKVSIFKDAPPLPGTISTALPLLLFGPGDF